MKRRREFYFDETVFSARLFFTSFAILASSHKGISSVLRVRNSSHTHVTSACDVLGTSNCHVSGFHSQIFKTISDILNFNLTSLRVCIPTLAFLLPQGKRIRKFRDFTVQNLRRFAYRFFFCNCLGICLVSCSNSWYAGIVNLSSQNEILIQVTRMDISTVLVITFDIDLHTADRTLCCDKIISGVCLSFRRRENNYLPYKCRNSQCGNCLPSGTGCSACQGADHSSKFHVRVWAGLCGRELLW